MRFLLLLCCLLGTASYAASVGGDNVPGTTQRCQAYLPRSERLKNTGGSDGSGLCVFTSIEHSGREQFVRVLRGFQAWMKKKPGGGYPQKVDLMLAQYCKEKGVAVPRYIQVNATDLDFLKAALKTGRLACITYGWSPSGRYSGSTIAHMVNLAHADGDNWAVLDNNYIDQLEWLSEKEFLQAHTTKGRDRGWSIVFYESSPPGPFHN